MNILKPIHPIHIPQAFSKAKTEAHSKDVCLRAGHGENSTWPFLSWNREVKGNPSPAVPPAHPDLFIACPLQLLNSTTMFAICMQLIQCFTYDLLL